MPKILRRIPLSALGDFQMTIFMIVMTIPFHYATRHKTTIKGMVIRAMFFGCRFCGEKNGIFYPNSF